MEDTTSQPVERMSFLDRFLPVWIMLAMAAGLALGRAVPGLSGALERLEVGGISLPIALGLMLAGTLVTAIWRGGVAAR